MLRDGAGRDNWTFGAPRTTPAPLRLPPIRHFTITDGHVTLDDARRRRARGLISSNERVTGYARPIHPDRPGQPQRRAFLAQILGGPLINVDPDKPYPFRSDIRAGATMWWRKAPSRGRRPGRLPGDPAGSPAPTWPASTTDRGGDAGTRRPTTWPATWCATARLSPSPASTAGWALAIWPAGGGDRHGRPAQADRQPHLEAVEAGRPDAGDRRGAARRDQGTIASPKQKAWPPSSLRRPNLPDARLDVSRVRQTDADVRYGAESVDAGPLPVTKLALHARLDTAC